MHPHIPRWFELLLFFGGVGLLSSGLYDHYRGVPWSASARDYSSAPVRIDLEPLFATVAGVVLLGLLVADLLLERRGRVRGQKRVRLGRGPIVAVWDEADDTPADGSGPATR